MKPNNQRHRKREKQEYQKPRMRKVKLTTDPSCNIAVVSITASSSCGSMA